MKIDRLIPTSAALTAAVDLLDKSQVNETDETNRAFSEWFAAEREDLRGVPGGYFTRKDSLLSLPGLPLDIATKVIEEVPATPSGLAWKAAMIESIALTEGDIYRPFDLCTYDTPAEESAAQALTEFAERLRETSPLLDVVADTIDGLSFYGSSDLGNIAKERARLTPQGLTVGELHECDKHEDCYDDNQALVRWEHIDAIAPGTETRVRELLADLDAGLPAEVGEGAEGIGARQPAASRGRR